MTTLGEYQEALEDLAYFASPRERRAMERRGIDPDTGKPKSEGKPLETKNRQKGKTRRAGYIDTYKEQGSGGRSRAARPVRSQAEQQARSIVEGTKVRGGRLLSNIGSHVSKHRGKYIAGGLLGTGAIGAAALLSRRRKKKER